MDTLGCANENFSRARKDTLGCANENFSHGRKALLHQQASNSLERFNISVSKRSPPTKTALDCFVTAVTREGSLFGFIPHQAPTAHPIAKPN